MFRPDGQPEPRAGNSSSSKSQQKRCCRAGCGDEMNAGVGDTPGFKLRDKPAVVRDIRDFNKLELPRNTKRMVQTSMDVLRCWRGNCDVQLLIYDSDPMSPDLSEIARVTDYVVAYACKGNATLQMEKDVIQDVIMRYVLTFVDSVD